MRDLRLAPYRGPSLVFAVYLVIQAASAAALFSMKLGGGSAGIRTFYLGSEERFVAARSLAGILEVAVPHLAAIPLALFAAAHVVGFARAVPSRIFTTLVALSFGSALAGTLSGFGVRWVSPELAWLKVVSFAGLEVGLLCWATLLVAIFVPGRGTAPDGAGATEEDPLP